MVYIHDRKAIFVDDGQKEKPKETDNGDRDIRRDDSEARARATKGFKE
jgi:hypothetical protein